MTAGRPAGPGQVDQACQDLSIRPLCESLWEDFEALFSERGDQNGCWCMYWRATRAEFQRRLGEGNKQAFHELVRAGHPTGLVAFLGERPVGWVSVAPREEFPVLGRSPTLKPVDDLPVWSLVCFFITRPWRRAGLTRALIQAAVSYARENGGRILEAYPIHEHALRFESDRYMGLTSTFEKAGFRVALERSPRRPILRYQIPAPPD